MRKDVKRMDVKEFRAKGFLQELNRQFLHPLGLAIEVIIDEETGDESLGGVWDYRDDPEGMLFFDLSQEDHAIKFEHVDALYKEKYHERVRKFGFGVQPIGNKLEE